MCKCKDKEKFCFLSEVDQLVTCDYCYILTTSFMRIVYRVLLTYVFADGKPGVVPPQIPLVDPKVIEVVSSLGKALPEPPIQIPDLKIFDSNEKAEETEIINQISAIIPTIRSPVTLHNTLALLQMLNSLKDIQDELVARK
ncbi:hypothetical protein ABEB36_006042 [Hypothenemus hampei]|uniref:Uncharacterized protein n=1 Tax=Hypothenemus hampei TaxID=57062 RepID=A0ABD1F3E7_HYPHA